MASKYEEELAWRLKAGMTKGTARDAARAQVQRDEKDLQMKALRAAAKELRR